MLALLFKFAGAYKFLLLGAGVAALAGSVWLHFHNDGKRTIELIAAQARLMELESANEGFVAQVGSLNQRIIANNQQKLADMQAAQEQLDAANLAIFEVTTQNEVITEQLAVANFNILEAMRDDEDYADWAFEPTHITVWGQLRDAAEGSSPTE